MVSRQRENVERRIRRKTLSPRQLHRCYRLLVTRRRPPRHRCCYSRYWTVSSVESSGSSALTFPAPAGGYTRPSAGELQPAQNINPTILRFILYKLRSLEKKIGWYSSGLSVNRHLLILRRVSKIFFFLHNAKLSYIFLRSRDFSKNGKGHDESADWIDAAPSSSSFSQINDC